MNTNSGTEKDYIRMFEFAGVPVLITNIFLDGYKEVEVCVTFDGTWWTSYMPKTTIERTLEEGRLGVYKDTDSYQKFKKDFYKYRERSTKRFDEIVSLLNVDQKTFSEFYNLLTEIYRFYKKTEFFFVDNVLGATDLDDEHKKMADDFGRFKLEAREYLNKQFISEPRWLTHMIALISKQTKLTEVDIFNMSREEIEGVLGGQSFDVSILKDRKVAYMADNFNQKTIFTFGLEASKQIQSFKNIEPAKELKGTIANKGYAKGVARVMLFDFNSMDTICR